MAEYEHESLMLWLALGLIVTNAAFFFYGFFATQNLTSSIPGSIGVTKIQLAMNNTLNTASSAFNFTKTQQNCAGLAQGINLNYLGCLIFNFTGPIGPFLIGVITLIASIILIIVDVFNLAFTVWFVFIPGLINAIGFGIFGVILSWIDISIGIIGVGYLLATIANMRKIQAGRGS